MCKMSNRGGIALDPWSPSGFAHLCIFQCCFKIPGLQLGAPYRTILLMRHDLVQRPIRIDPKRMIDWVCSYSYDLFPMRLRRGQYHPVVRQDERQDISSSHQSEKEATYECYPFIPYKFLGHPGIRSHPVFPQYKNMPFREHDSTHLPLPFSCSASG